MTSSNPIAGPLSQLIKCLHNQQPVTLDPTLPQMLNPPLLQSITLRLLVDQVNFTIQKIPQNIQSRPQYFESPKFIPSDNVKKIGSISRIISKLCKFPTKQEQYLAEYQTLKFLELFPVVPSTQKNPYPNSMLNNLKPLFPRTNVHKENLPLYMPFYNSIESYYTPVPIGNPMWELARRQFKQLYESQMSFISQQGQTPIKDAWFELLMCEKEYLKRFEHRVEYIWAIMHFYYMQETLKPYRNIVDDQSMCAQGESQISQNQIFQALERSINLQTEPMLSLVLKCIRYQLTEKHEHLLDVITMVQQIFSQLTLQSNTNHESNNNAGVTSICLINTLCSQIVRNLIQIEQSQPITDENRVNTLKLYLTTTINTIHNCATKRLPYHDFYLRIAHPVNTNDQRLKTQNQLSLLNTLTNELNKDTPQEYPFPQYAYFERQFYEHFSKLYLQKYPQKILQLATFLPSDVAVWRLLNSTNLEDKKHFFQINSILLEKSQQFIHCIRHKIPELTQSDYVNFIQSWKLYHEAIEQEPLEYNRFLQKLNRCQSSIKYLFNLNLPQLFKKHIYCVSNKGQNILKLMNHTIQGLEETLQLIDDKTRKDLIKRCQSIILYPQFKTQLLSKLTELEKDTFWKHWSTVLIADESLVNQLMGVEQSSMEEKQVARPQPKKQPPNQVIVMDLDD